MTNSLEKPFGVYAGPGFGTESARCIELIFVFLWFFAGGLALLFLNVRARPPPGSAFGGSAKPNPRRPLDGLVYLASVSHRGTTPIGLERYQTDAHSATAQTAYIITLYCEQANVPIQLSRHAGVS